MKKYAHLNNFYNEMWNVYTPRRLDEPMRIWKLTNAKLKIELKYLRIIHKYQV